MDNRIEERMRRLEGDTIFVGLGNEYMGDDAAGMVLVRLLAQGGARILEAGNDLMGAMHNLSQKNFHHAIFVDAAGMGLDPGEARILEGDEISGRCISTHENNFPLALHYMKCLNPSSHILFLGIQFNTLEMQETPMLSPEVKKSVENLARTILSAVTAGDK